MKKLSILSAVLGMTFMGAAGAANITVYYSPTCPHCHHAREFISSNLIYEYPELTVSEVNVMDQANLPAFQDALKKCEYDNGGVPVLVIGEKCFQGYADFMQQELRDAVEVDLSDEAKNVAAENKKALAENPEQFKADHSDRLSAIIDSQSVVAQNADAAQPASDDQPVASQDTTPDAPVVSNETKKSDKGSSMYFYALLIVLVAALGFVLIRTDKKK